MAKAVLVLFSAICFVAVATFVAAYDPDTDDELFQYFTVVGHHQTSLKPVQPADNVLNVVGQLYCDPCHLQYITPLSTPIAGAGVRLECVNQETNKVTYSVEDLTNKDGFYQLHVEGDHEEEICQVKPINSTMPNCAAPMGDVSETRITCTKNSGMHDGLRFAAPLGFVTKEVDPRCTKFIQDLTKFDDDEQ